MIPASLIYEILFKTKVTLCNIGDALKHDSILHFFRFLVAKFTLWTKLILFTIRLTKKFILQEKEVQNGITLGVRK